MANDKKSKRGAVATHVLPNRSVSSVHCPCVFKLMNFNVSSLSLSLCVCQIEKSKSSSLKGHPPTRSFSAAVSTTDTLYPSSCVVKRALRWCRFVRFYCRPASATLLLHSFPKCVFINIYFKLICLFFFFYSSCSLNLSLFHSFLFSCFKELHQHNKKNTQKNSLDQ